MKKHLLKQKTLKLLVLIHRGFLTKEQSDQLTDSEVLSNVPENRGTYMDHVNDETREARVSPFTFRWVKQKVKANPDVTAEELLKSAGFK